ncbi:probable N-acetyltransferase camello [Scyliorhinus torazame]|uniref:probable N-acetyltransferase camello n=1 Tax=Scyliorhinus torazame TaxID=75743 RepID=UPI003B591EDF
MRYQIRLYQEGDYDAVRDIYVSGVQEHFPRACRYVLKQPCTVAVLGLSFCLLLIVSSSLLLSLSLMVILLALGYLLLRHIWSQIIEQNLMQDLLDIGSSYMKHPACCFWVAVSNGSVVGTVGAIPSKFSPITLELKRLNVCLEYRGLGIAKALCLTVREFAHRSGFADIVLRTSVIQTEAQNLYQKLGYILVDTIPVPHPLAKVTNYTTSKYQYHIPRGPELQPQEKQQRDHIRLCATQELLSHCHGGLHLGSSDW